MEIMDAYREDGSLAGYDLVRQEPVPDGLYQLVCEVLVKHADGTFLVMQRDQNKIGYPGMFEASASGAALKGETPLVAAKRELREETGINAEELTPIYLFLKVEHIFFCRYLCVTDCDKSSVILQPGETIAYRWLEKKEFLRFMDSEEFIAGHRDRLLPYLESI